MRLSTVRTSPEFSASLHESRFRSTIVHRLPTPVGDPCQRLLLCIPSIDPPPGIPVFGSNERPSSPALAPPNAARSRVRVLLRPVSCDSSHISGYGARNEIEIPFRFLYALYAFFFGASIWGINFLIEILIADLRAK